MAGPKRKKVWRVQPEWVGRVAIESQLKKVVLTNDLTDEQLLKLSKSPIAEGFLEHVYITIPTNE